MVPRPKLIFIAGTNYSGTTLMSSILGCHPDVESVGQLFELPGYVERSRKCMCGTDISDCMFWQEVLEDTGYFTADRKSLRYADGEFSYGGSIKSRLGLVIPVKPRHVSGFREFNRSVLISVRKISNRSVIVDSSKNPHRLKWLILSGACLDLDLRVIRMTRNGLGVVASYIKRGNGVIRASTAWAWRNLQVEKVLRTHVRRESMALKYEDLCSDPEAAVKEVCSFSGIDFVPQMLDFRARTQHQIGGNPMRFGTSREIRIDEKWRQELGPKQRATFRLVAGRLQKRLGY